jgi:hypothetical protein
MVSLKRAGEEGSATLPSDPSCPVPNTKGLPHLQGGETIAGCEDPSSRVIIPPLGQRPAVDRLPSGTVQLEVCKSVASSRQRELCRGAGLWILANRINRSDSHVSQHQDSPKWVNLSPQAISREGRLAAHCGSKAKVRPVPFGDLPHGDGFRSQRNPSAQRSRSKTIAHISQYCTGRGHRS